MGQVFEKQLLMRGTKMQAARKNDPNFPITSPNIEIWRSYGQIEVIFMRRAHFRVLL